MGCESRSARRACVFLLLAADSASRLVRTVALNITALASADNFSGLKKWSFVAVMLFLLMGFYLRAPCEAQRARYLEDAGTESARFVSGLMPTSFVGAVQDMIHAFRVSRCRNHRSSLLLDANSARSMLTSRCHCDERAISLFGSFDGCYRPCLSPMMSLHHNPDQNSCHRDGRRRWCFSPGAPLSGSAVRRWFFSCEVPFNKNRPRTFPDLVTCGQCQYIRGQRPAMCQAA